MLTRAFDQPLKATVEDQPASADRNGFERPVCDQREQFGTSDAGNAYRIRNPHRQHGGGLGGAFEGSCLGHRRIVNTLRAAIKITNGPIV
ncbi:hypothetical protein [Sphingomonas sp.]|uniref:hypothetical protein n=1 Tax=Sphingomonas sp. TaxID=28214 RepID=UPI003D6D9CB6